MNARKARILRKAAHIMATEPSALSGNPVHYPAKSAVRIYRTLKKQCQHDNELYQAVCFVVAARDVGKLSKDAAEKLAAMGKAGAAVGAAFRKTVQRLRGSNQRPSRNLG